MEPDSVLLVDDDKDILEMLADGLQEYFPVIITANNGQQALKEFGKHRPRVVITDIRMPHMGGIQLVEEIRKVDQLAVIAICGVDPIGLREGVLKGANLTFEKPFTVRHVIKAVQKLSA